MRRLLFWTHKLKIAGLIILVLVFSSCAIDKKALQARASLKPKKDNYAKIKPFPQKQPVAPRWKPSKPYILGVEDVVKISVINKAGLDTTQAIRPDGKISFYPMGDIQAAGRTLQQLRTEIIQRLKADLPKPYVLGLGDVLKISVYDNSSLNVSQAIRPDGMISIVPAGDIQAAGLTVDGLRKVIEEKLLTLIKDPIVAVVVDEYKSHPILINDPIVNIVVTEYNSRKVAILGAVDQPGVVRLKSDTSLIEGISQTGGLSDDADLRRAMIFRNQKLLPVNFEKLFKKGDISQNILLQANDSIFIPSSRDNKVYVIGEVKKPGSVSWKGRLSLLEAISLAGGYSRNAKPKNVLIIKGGLVDPSLMLLDAQSITKKGILENNIALESGDIVYVPISIMATAERYLDFANKIMQPILNIESGMVLGKQVKDIFLGEDTGATPIAITP